MSPPIDKVQSDEKLPTFVDVVVIGGGIAGITAALELARRGTSVAILEKGYIAGEQSGRNWGWCRQQNRAEGELPLMKLSLQLWEGYQQDFGIDLGFRRTGLVYGTDNPSDLDAWERWSKMASGYGVTSRVLTAAETSALLPGNARRWLGGVHSPSDAFAEPDRAVPAMALMAQRLGATIHQRCAVRELEFSAGRVSGVITEHGLLKCSSVLVAAGAWSNMLLRHHGFKFLQASVQSTTFCTTPVQGVSEGGVSMQDIALRKRVDGGLTVGISGYGRLHLSPRGVQQVKPFWPMFQRRRAGLTYSLGRYFFEGPDAIRRWSADGVSPFEVVRVLDPEPEARLIARGLKGLTDAYPHLKGTVSVAHSWAGMVDQTPDSIQVISPVQSTPGLFISSGYSGHGFGTGPGAGHLAADLIRGDTPCTNPSPFRYERMIDGTDLSKAAKASLI
ncbi:FAD-binding oxidoreductase [Verticiella sediminum]|uniref:FAD-binding oxidoreductase n=1 Tax=Verticiella sediminum TaxID=1247510 RepID=A0A556AQ09_9BURK|nr:FAD-binding oxidoreductase [Verticiella sediminum]TSH94984.1 FAD-binding oxidoreductase [Verticiella sediminum]